MFVYWGYDFGKGGTVNSTKSEFCWSENLGKWHGPLYSSFPSHKIGLNELIPIVC